jgi:hypothetical protein
MCIRDRNYGGSGEFKKIGEDLFSLPWPSQFTKCSLKLWRVMVLEQSLVDSILQGKSLKVDTASSWSKSETVAREFIHQHWFDLYADRLKQPCAVLLSTPGSGLKCLDIDALHNDPAFKAAQEAFEDAGTFFSEGLDIGDAQKEVAVYRFTLTKQMIHDAIPFNQRSWIRKV